MNDFKKLKEFTPISSSLTIKRSSIHGLGLFAIKQSIIKSASKP